MNNVFYRGDDDKGKKFIENGFNDYYVGELWFFFLFVLILVLSVICMKKVLRRVLI